MAVHFDLMMPHMDGQEFFDHIRGLNSTVPVILSSGYSEEEAMKRFHHPGIAAFIQKPYQVEVLIAKIQEIRQKIANPSRTLA
jgi:CheY-like chemotaxis protein